jgi:hypothetical protein
MILKGFIIEDDQGKEFVLLCERSFGRSGRAFLLRGWQRLRLVPLQYTEQELRKIVVGVRAALHDLFRSLPRLIEHISGDSPNHSSVTQLPRRTPVLRKARRQKEEVMMHESP